MTASCKYTSCTHLESLRYVEVLLYNYYPALKNKED